MNTDKLHQLRLMKPLLTKCHLVGLPQACRRVAVGLAVFALALVLLGTAWAGDGDLDPSFNPGAGVNQIPRLWNQVYYNDGLGNSLITGIFTQVGAHPTRAIARLLADGSPDTGFTSPVISGWVNNCYLLNPADANSKILIAGPFEIPSTDGPYYGLARLNANGTVDISFAHTFGPSPGMSGFGVQNDGKLVVGGYALPVNGYPGTTYYLLRLDADGIVDDTFPKRSAPGGFVRSVQAYIDDLTFGNQVRLLGCFPRLSDPTHLDYMLLLNTNGTTELARIGDEIVNGMILQMWIQGDSKMVIVGDFDRVYNTPMNGVARLGPFPTVGLDPDFNNFGSGANGFVQRVWLESGNKLVIAGYFTAINGTPCGYFARLNYNGSLDTTFNTGGIGANDRVWTMFKRSSDSTWMIYGAFQSVNGSTRQCMANLSSTGSLNDQYAAFSLANVDPSSLKVNAIRDSRQGIYIGGYFSSYGGKFHGQIARLNFDGAPDASFKIYSDGTVKSISTQQDGKVLVAGNFGNVGYTPRTGLVRLNLDGTLDRAFFPLVVKADGTMPDICEVNALDNGKILIAGDFAQIADVNRVMQPRSAFARLNSDGSLDDTFNAQITISGGINIKVNAGGEMDGMYPMGGYVLYQGSPAGFFTRLTSTGALDPDFGPTGGPAPHINLFDGEVRCGTDTADGRVVVGGDFTHVFDGQSFSIPRGYIARFNTNGLLDNTFVITPGANNPIYALQKQYPKDKLFIGGAFTSYNGVVRNRLARLNPNGSVDVSFNPGSGANGPVYAFDWNDYIRRLRIGGGFTTYQDVSRPRIAQIFASAGSFDPSLLLLLMD